MSTIYIKDIDLHTQLGLYSIDADLRIEQACPTAICKDLQKKSTPRQQETTYSITFLTRRRNGGHKQTNTLLHSTAFILVRKGNLIQIIFEYITYIPKHEGELYRKYKR